MPDNSDPIDESPGDDPEHPRIGWPPIDLNAVSGQAQPRNPSVLVAYAAGLTPPIASTVLGWCRMEMLSIVVGVVGFVCLVDTYYRQREKRSKWTNALGVGYFIGLVVFMAGGLMAGWLSWR